ncbi:hypothetical protein DEA8626_03092 [Defluviimonas aquaemixtae]|uniref:Ubiquitinol-cytochrome C reductase Fe-S subunit TAT signal domain-containing protein n=1 Tax=Albidovulum aquaemixtae TaxID=1542388 RepID=A0A2R8BL16_9RHOB|nr:twin-arginine translocation signal domain-containing protein [Defluviimonas aquaemixtae]SPH24044.1 hypothetical protein DEA8626_03092 [Defluviimonas aquaemixtae]
MGKTDDAKKASRRDFLKLAATTAPAAAAATALSGTEVEATELTKAEGLQDTAHTRAYYKSARF